MRTRNQFIDLLKGIAVVLMIQVHIIELFASNSVSSSSYGNLLLFLGGPLVAPIFAIILGYNIASSNKTTKQLIIRGLSFFILGMVLNIALNFNLILSVYRGVLEIDLLPYIFGSDILHFAGLVIIVISILKNVFLKSNILLVFSSVLVVFLGQFLIHFIPENLVLKYMTSFFYGSSHWSYFPLFPWLVYPLIGLFFYNLSQKFDFTIIQNTKYKLGIFVAFVLFLLFTLSYAIKISSNLPMYYHHNYTFTIWLIVFVSFYVFFMNEINKFLAQTLLFKYLAWLGKNVTMAYVVQWIIIGNIATVIYKTIDNPYVLLTYYFSIFVFTSAVIFLISKVSTYFKST